MNIYTRIKNFINRLVSFDRVEPVSRIFGIDRGTPIDRYYIKYFLNKNLDLFTGKVLEVGENTYSTMYGKNEINSYILEYDNKVSKINSNIIVGDLTKTNELPSEEFDLFVCTQTLNFIYDVQTAISGIYKVLKLGGTGLITVACLTQISRYDSERWGDFWRFTPQGIQRMFQDVFGVENVIMTVYGNSYSATHFIKGYAENEVNSAKLNKVDVDYPVVICLKVLKK